MSDNTNAPTLDDVDSPPDQIIHLTEPLSLSESLRPDGYEPLAIGLMSYAGLAGFPHEEEFWYMASAARRLDAAHRLFEQVREGLDSYKANQGGIEELFAVLGTVELAMVAMHRAVDMSYRAGNKLNVNTTWPAKVEGKRKAIAELRNAYEHIDDRALGMIGPGKKANDKKQAHTLFGNVYGAGGIGESLIKDRKLTYRQWSLGIDNEATDLFKLVREYLRDAGVEVIDRHSRSQQPSI